ncbi:DUF3087 family protein [Marinobacterium sediminicola]|uniref:DUF3087 domain-containing protein n=1 Tax=Marinobacterium sediminicola TaxID=518898 RepID=A0ABY1S109_9GAMM|nr:DUF3087 family protein [Marinobacterium sediminicola]ULG69822.1 DUF3087 domain-containing protein [Marinobacterium sediminicola]SMR75364.1 Protein of unknown function [Marinobacterium sediminicola]
MSDIFTLESRNPEQYRQETRKSNLIVMATFAILAMTLATLSVRIFGSPEGGNFIWNLAGVLSGVIATTLVFKGYYWQQPWMDSARYGWQLKRSLMSVTNILHAVKDGVERNDHTALKVMRFYHLGLEQMYRLENNESELRDLQTESQAHLDRLLALGIAPEQTSLDPAWIEQLKPPKRTKR